MFKKLNEKLKGYRTVLFGTGLVTVGVALEVFSYLDAAPLEAFLPAWVTIPIGVVTILLRRATKTPVGKK